LGPSKEKISLFSTPKETSLGGSVSVGVGLVDADDGYLGQSRHHIVSLLFELVDVLDLSHETRFVFRHLLLAFEILYRRVSMIKLKAK
jgi:hypothetical protein